MLSLVFSFLTLGFGEHAHATNELRGKLDVEILEVLLRKDF